MPKQTIPDIEFNRFVIAEFPSLFYQNKIFINREYQRGDIWTQTQKIELIRSILSCYSIGVLVLYVNDDGKYEILDGQQRLLTVKQYLDDKLDLSNTEILRYADLSLQDKTLFDAYCVFYLRLKSADPSSKEEDVVQTFLRLQEGTPLNKAEKINARRGEFKDAFKEAREQHPLFALLGNDKRFRLRQLAAELLTLELESDFKNIVFPDLGISTLIATIDKYRNGISNSKMSYFKGNLDCLHNSLNILLTAFKPAELISFYLLVSYLRRHKANNENLINELSAFCGDFLENLNRFSMYDTKPPKGMSQADFVIYMKYKLLAKKMTLADSIKERFGIILSEFKKAQPFIEKDTQRLYDVEQKRAMYFKQHGICPVCHKSMQFTKTSGHHTVPHSRGGITANLEKGMLAHDRCHIRLEKQNKKIELPGLLMP
jgi:hypothetical protein